MNGDPVVAASASGEVGVVVAGGEGAVGGRVALVGEPCIDCAADTCPVDVASGRRSRPG
jgi:hypothetical protein